MLSLFLLFWAPLSLGAQPEQQPEQETVQEAGQGEAGEGYSPVHVQEQVQERPKTIHEMIQEAEQRASAHYRVPLELLMGIRKVESRGYPWALCINLGKGRSVSLYPRSYQEALYYLARLATDNIDIGPWQVNYHHIGKRAGVSKEQMLNPYISSMLAAYKLAYEIALNGYTWSAVGNYHSRALERKAPYIDRLKQQLRKEGYHVN